MRKRRIALFIALSLLLSGIAAYAADPLTDIEKSPHKSAIYQMVELGILSGRGDGLFWPNEKLTRAEAAKVAMFLEGFDDRYARQAARFPQAFSDVHSAMEKHKWSLGWINLATQEGIIQGYGTGKYGPGDNLTMSQWAAILIRILGHEDKDLEWPADYDQLAKDLGLTQGLEYQGNSQIKRDQMARFTVNAIYNVEKADGSKIIDLLEEKAKNPDDHLLEIIHISSEISPKFVGEGGGKKVDILVTVTDETGKPVEDAKVVFHAYAFEAGERDGQLSHSELKTDASGKAKTTYTTLAKDDKKMVGISVSSFKDFADSHMEYNIMAANQAAIVTGEVKDPYTGNPVEGIHVHFMANKTNKSVGSAETDKQGRYSMIIPTGTYQVTFEMAMRDQKTASFSNHGQTYTLDVNKGILKGVVTGVSPGNKVMALRPNFKPGIDDWTLQADIQKDGSFTLALDPNKYELFIVGRSSPFKTGVTVQRGQVTDIGNVNAR